MKSSIKLDLYGTTLAVQKDIKASSHQKSKTIKDFKWKVVKPWFVAHDIHKMESAFVVSVKFATHIKVYISATSKG